MDGDTGEVLEAYEKECEHLARTRQVLKDPNQRRGDGRVRFIGIDVIGTHHSESVCLGEALTMKLFYRANQDLLDVRFYIYILDELGNGILFCSNHFSGEIISVKEGRGVVHFIIRKNPLSPGKYWINADIYAGGIQCDYVEKIQNFTVGYGDFYGTGMIPNPKSGRVVIEYEWTTPLEPLGG